VRSDPADAEIVIQLLGAIEGDGQEGRNSPASSSCAGISRPSPTPPPRDDASAVVWMDSSCTAGHSLKASIGPSADHHYELQEHRLQYRATMSVPESGLVRPDPNDLNYRKYPQRGVESECAPVLEPGGATRGYPMESTGTY
jgi:hypothetical protein